MTDDRESKVRTFLRTLKQRVPDPGSEHTPRDQDDDPVRQLTKRDDLPRRFRSAAIAAGMQVHVCSRANWLEAVLSIKHPQPNDTVWLPDKATGSLTETSLGELRHALRAGGWIVVTGVDDATLFSASLAITAVDAAIAETGSIICSSGPHTPRGASLLPPMHVAVVHEDQLMPDLCDFFDQPSDQCDSPAAIHLITGPSKTADIEGVLVTGVHGPAEVHIILICDDKR